jgi:ElaA protein
MLELKWFKGESEDLTDARAIRRAVFIDEQGLTEAAEFDGTDDSCVHLVLYDEGQAVATGRVFIGDDFYKIGRVATIMTHRGRGIATRLIEALIGACVKMGGNWQIVHAQTTARGFYEKIGFVASGSEFIEAGVPHIKMEHYGNVKKCPPKTGGCGCGGCGGH